MMGEAIIGIGIDLVKRDRIKDAVQKWDKRFLNRIFTPAEQEYAFAHKSPYLHLAGRFAAKEATLKALGTGWRGGVRWNEISVINEPANGPSVASISTAGRPRVEVAGKVKALMDELGVEKIQISISHDTDYSIAQVVLIGRGGKN